VKETETDGIRRLPPGPHGLPPELVERNQRERLIAAMAEECAAGGYAATSVTGIARRAGVSTASFYRQFKDRRDCMLVSFEELFGRLLEGIERACAAEQDVAERTALGIRTVAVLLAGDPPTARLLTLEILSVGEQGARLQHEAIDRLAAALHEARGADTVVARPFPTVEWVAVAAMVSLAAKRAAEGKSPDAAELEAVCAWLDAPRVDSVRKT
jgi:AcrR family transcriptional regulator